MLDIMNYEGEDTPNTITFIADIPYNDFIAILRRHTTIVQLPIVEGEKCKCKKITAKYITTSCDACKKLAIVNEIESNIEYTTGEIVEYICDICGKNTPEDCYVKIDGNGVTIDYCIYRCNDCHDKYPRNGHYLKCENCNTIVFWSETLNKNKDELTKFTCKNCKNSPALPVNAVCDICEIPLKTGMQWRQLFYSSSTTHYRCKTCSDLYPKNTRYEKCDKCNTFFPSTTLHRIVSLPDSTCSLYCDTCNTIYLTDFVTCFRCGGTFNKSRAIRWTNSTFVGTRYFCGHICRVGAEI